MKESTTVGRTAGGVTDCETWVGMQRIRQKSIKLIRQQDVSLPIQHHVYASMYFQKDGLTPACSVATSLLVMNLWEDNW